LLARAGFRDVKGQRRGARASVARRRADVGGESGTRALDSAAARRMMGPPRGRAAARRGAQCDTRDSSCWGYWRWQWRQWALPVPHLATTTRVSVSSAATQGNSESRQPAISSDGRFVAFESVASNLVPNDTNSQFDVFVRDVQTGTTTRVSVDSTGNQGNFESQSSSISSDGRFVAFGSGATNLVAGDTNNAPDSFVHDRDTDGDGTLDEPGAVATTRVSVDSAGNQANGFSSSPAITGGGRYVAFASGATNLVTDDTNGIQDIFVHDRITGTTELVSVDSTGNQANAYSNLSGISADGRFVGFQSSASNLVPGDTNACTGYTTCVDVFVRDRDTDGDGIFGEAGAVSTSRVSVDSTGNQANGHSFSYDGMSANGRFVSFYSIASNLIPGDNRRLL